MSSVAPAAGSDDLARQISVLKAFFSRRLRAQSVVEDLVQDVLLRIHTRRSTDPIENFQGYLFQTASNVLRDHLRRETVRAVVTSHDPQDLEIADAEPGVERVFQAKEEIAQVLQALDELPERTRDIFLMRRYEGMAYMAIAQRVGISVSAVEKQMVRAISHLARRLGK